MNNESYMEDISSAMQVIAEEMEAIARRTPNLRELAAIAAMQGLLARAQQIEPTAIAKMAVECADSLLKQLK